MLILFLTFCQPLNPSEAEERIASLEADLEALQDQNGEATIDLQRYSVVTKPDVRVLQYF